MSTPYERIVAEDFNLGYGSVQVTMPGGGAATGSQVGIHTWTGGSRFNVQDFGAIGDGLADDSAAFQAAMTAALAVSGTVYVPIASAFYRIRSQLSVSSATHQISIVGEGYGSHIQLDATITGFLLVATSVPEPTGGVIRQVRITGSASATTAVAIFLNGSKSYRVEDCWIESVGTGIKIDNAADISLSRLIFMDLTPSTGVGLKLVLVNGLWLSDITHTIGNVLGGEDANGAPAGFCLMNESAGTSVVRVFGTNIYVRHAGYAFKFAPTGVSTRVDTVYITNFYFDACNSPSIQCTTDSDSFVQNVTFHHGVIGDHDAAATLVDSNGVEINGAFCRGIKLRHVLFGAIGKHGVSIGANTTTGDYIEIDSCSFGSIGTETSNTYDCVNVAAGACGFIVRDCVLAIDGSENGLSHRYGVFVAVGASNRYQIVGNRITGASGPQSDGGTGSDAIVASHAYGSRSWRVFGASIVTNASGATMETWAQSGTGNADIELSRSAGTTATWTNRIPTGANDLTWLLDSTNKFGLLGTGGFFIQDGVTAPSATAGRAKIYVDTSDGDLKIIFGDGTIKTIVVDT